MRENFRTNFVDGLQKKWKKLRYVISTKNALTTGKKRNDRVTRTVYLKKTGIYAVVVGQYLFSSENMGAKFMPRRTLHCIH